MTAHSRIPVYCENIHNRIIADVLGRMAKIIGVFKYAVGSPRNYALPIKHPPPPSPVLRKYIRRCRQYRISTSQRNDYNNANG